MCWNAEVSLNTFAFSFFVLCFLIYNNAYTKYKFEELDNIYVYLFFLSVISMQAVEFFMWRNIKNVSYTRGLSIIGIILIVLQPFFAVLTIYDQELRMNTALVYACIAIPMFIYNITTYTPNVKISSIGNLRQVSWWGENWTQYIWYFVYYFFMVFGLIMSKNYTILLFGAVSLLWAFFNYYRTQTIGSLFCWSINSISIFIAMYLLIYLPLREN